MKRVIIIAVLLLCQFSCRDSGQDKSEASSQNAPKTYQEENTEPTGNSNIEDTSVTARKTGIDAEKYSDENREISAGNIAGKYIRKDHNEDINCSCYCLEIVLSGTSELCLADKDLYINARFQQNGNKINVYYDGKASKTTNTEIPWEKFDKTVKIAEITTEPDGGLKLDWKGFSIDNKIAVDYALYGKKTLEGTYKKL
ncbi:hypothetical protein C7S20_01540 [Christiangramia fulva]|uniref:Uncharacterized protein n=1 Tax=Christiangramia fulva TaxID=2126553 RepID=A0A2R3Z1B7_9FLAO|nr:hypothetical protein [Christiangramia fulva]AVR44049.1 hypothetical protein C7S20_01540 [Christiangramia fulva]